jgi:ABC-type spermidine/putrescine transport system permease subunit II
MENIRIFLVALLSFLKSTQIPKFPFFLGTTTIGDNHVASSIGWINPIVNSLLISYLTTTI